MRVVEKLELIDKIGRELQSRFSYVEIDVFLKEFGIEPSANFNANSKWLYSKAALSGVETAIIKSIAHELEISRPGILTDLPRNWKDTSDFRLFISTYLKTGTKRND